MSGFFQDWFYPEREDEAVNAGLSRDNLPSGLLELADRCEAATGPDRELDCLIYEALNPSLIRVAGSSNFGRFVNDKRYAKGAENYHLPGKTSIAPRYTASLDAAMTLVPEGWRLHGFYDYEDSFILSLMNEKSRETVGACSGRGLRASALCTAALRARAAQEGSQP